VYALLQNVNYGSARLPAGAAAWLDPAGWLENIEAGFELWRGGPGLGTDWFWARA
jgi:hypothetical protein